ncbi:hypothetical protein C1I95_13680 [Micromonospora craterilacus]|uniref:ABC3 transporter permease C-terminal domain-containing protein n=1 Tax=Micromonospora craterilacus TaxID=1655439 RepID=A0A2W2F9T5_9ACTN|nr:ABC transporter permease [Micromonospora craterilacus]PZG18347.1 hypothetical protein C1I95_13680 [Micromonospora craterilacus]
MSDLLLGARMAFSGGRDGWARAVLTAFGVGIGVALLLLAAAVPATLQARQARGDARYDFRLGEQLPAAANTLLVSTFDTEFRDRPVRGRILRPEGPQAPLPPGVAALPRAGEVVVSPALKKLLDSPDRDLFAPRLGHPEVIGTIGPQGLAGPHELAFYLGSDTLTIDGSHRTDVFGGGPPGEEFGPTLILLVVIIFVVLLLPIAVFLGAAVRFGGEPRERRLAALRLVGADRRMTHRIAAGEAMVGALLGIVVGGLLFAIGRQLVPLVTLWNISVYADDVRPSPPIVALIVVAVPVTAVVVSLIALRRVAIEPLGVTRRAASTRRRLWWRLIPPVIGLVLLAPLVNGVSAVGAVYTRYQVAAGAVLLLIGAVTLLPWLIDLLVRRLGGGPVAWQLAIRRLQLDSATSARLVSGIAVAVAGTIGLQMLFAGVQRQYTTETGEDTTRATSHVQLFNIPDGSAAIRQLLAVPGVTGGTGTLWAGIVRDGSSPDQASAGFLRIGDCPALAEYAELDRCVDGDVFRSLGPPDGGPSVDAFGPGTQVAVGERETPWTLPADTRTVPARASPIGWQRSEILATPGAIEAGRIGPLSVDTYLDFDRDDADTLERLRNTAAQLSRSSWVGTLSGTTQADRLTTIQRGLYIGIVVTLLLIGVSMLVGLLEQLRERRRLLAMLVAVGTRRATLAWSVFWQTVVPVLIGLTVAVGFGLALGSVLLRMVNMPISVSWPVIGMSTGLAAAAVLLVTGLGLPALWRLMRPAGLRTE